MANPIKRASVDSLAALPSDERMWNDRAANQIAA
jgi:hypothetical protein